MELIRQVKKHVMGFYGATIMLALLFLFGWGGLLQSMGFTLLAMAAVNVVVDLLMHTPVGEKADAFIFNLTTASLVVLGAVLTIVGIGGIIVVSLLIPIGILPDWQFGSIFGMGVGASGRIASIGLESLRWALENKK